MALTRFQREVCHLIAANRIASGESYVAGGAALSESLGGTRRSRDVDMFHDSEEALQAVWEQDRLDFEKAGYRVEVLRERTGHVEARVSRGGDGVLVEWARDSAFRFFPLVEHLDFGLTLHPFDLATNKVLALVGRLEARDWIDVIECDGKLQPVGYLAWAACAKDPGFGPRAIVEQAARTGRYTAPEVEALDFDGPPPDAGELSRRWHAIVSAARLVVEALPPEESGRCVLSASGELWRGDPRHLPQALAEGRLRFHAGSLRGTLPTVVG